jgi:hypothetical protein
MLVKGVVAETGLWRALANERVRIASSTAAPDRWRYQTLKLWATKRAVSDSARQLESITLRGTMAATKTVRNLSVDTTEEAEAIRPFELEMQVLPTTARSEGTTSVILPSHPLGEGPRIDLNRSLEEFIFFSRRYLLGNH